MSIIKQGIDRFENDQLKNNLVLMRWSKKILLYL